jgi:hypothetical protein
MNMKRKRHSTGMMAGGIVMVAFVPVALLVSLVASAEKSVCGVDDYNYDTNSYTHGDCNGYDGTIYGSLVVAAVLAGVGIPLIIVGAKKEWVRDDGAKLKLTPWATAHSAGLGLRVEM